MVKLENRFLASGFLLKDSESEYIVNVILSSAQNFELFSQSSFIQILKSNKRVPIADKNCLTQLDQYISPFLDDLFIALPEECLSPLIQFLCQLSLS